MLPCWPYEFPHQGERDGDDVERSVESRCYDHGRLECKYGYRYIFVDPFSGTAPPSLDILVHDINGRRQALVLSFAFFLVNIATSYKRSMFAPDLSKDLPLPLCFHQLCVFSALCLTDGHPWSSQLDQELPGDQTPRVRTRMPTWVPKCLTRLASRDPGGFRIFWATLTALTV